MITVQLARRLRDAGLRWQPGAGDRFFVPDRDLDDQTFAISDMTIDVRAIPGGRLLGFNGTVEWALDSIMEWEAVWLPGEEQLREALGGDFARLERLEGRYRCEVVFAGERLRFEHSDATEAYGLALEHRLRSGIATPPSPGLLSEGQPT